MVSQNVVGLGRLIFFFFLRVWSHSFDISLDIIPRHAATTRFARIPPWWWSFPLRRCGGGEGGGGSALLLSSSEGGYGTSVVRWYVGTKPAASALLVVIALVRGRVYDVIEAGCGKQAASALFGGDCFGP